MISLDQKKLIQKKTKEHENQAQDQQKKCEDNHTD